MRQRLHSGWAIFAFLALVFPDGIRSDQFGFVIINEILPGLTRTTRQYHSCILTLEQFVGTLNHPSENGHVVTTDLRNPRTHSLSPTFRSESLHAVHYPDFQLDGLHVIRLPQQSFLLQSTESLHKTFQAMVTFEGYYLLLRKASNSPVSSVLDNHFANVHFSQNESSVVAGDYYLVPVDQYATLQRIMNGAGPSTWQFTSTGSQVIPAVSVQPGIIRTGRGTVYDFRQNGSIDVYHRSGEVTHIAPPANDARGGMLPYASHAAILARQGIQVGSNDPVVAIETALAINERLIREHIRNGAHGAEAALNLLAYRLRQAHDQYTNTDDSNGRERAIRVGLNAATQLSPHLPSVLRWESPDGQALFTAPADVNGYYVLRVIRPFLFLRTDTQRPDVRLISPNALHLQALHASLGDFGLQLERDGHVAGGHLSYEYSPTTRHLTRIRFESNGIISLAHQRGTLLRLSPEEITQLRNSIISSIPWSTRHEIEVSIE